MRVLVTGSHGLIGTALVPALEDAGHHVTRLARSGTGASGTPGASPVWDPQRGQVEPSALEGHDAVVHLAGESIGRRRWSEAQRRTIRDSRVNGTAALADAIVGLDRPPAVLICASAVGYYGNRGDEELTETSTPGAGFLAELVRDWEAATQRARDAGVRVVHLRNAIVLSPTGGALRRQLPLFRLGLGGRLGAGRQYMSWISLGDEVGAILHVLADHAIAGPVNVAAPEPVTNAQFTRLLGRALHRPTVLPAPAAALRLVLGRGITDEMLLVSQRAVPAVLLQSRFSFRHPSLEGAFKALLAI